MRHRPKEPKLNKVLPWLAAERPELFNAYQQTQNERAEQALCSVETFYPVAARSIMLWVSTRR
jgi:hypothetical protein